MKWQRDGTVPHTPMRRFRSTATAVVAVVTVGLCMAAPAKSATVLFDGSVFAYVAGPGENNSVKITSDSSALFPTTDTAFVITDSELIIDGDGALEGGCLTLANFALCPGSEGTALSVDAGDGNDHVDVTCPGFSATCSSEGAGSVNVCGGPGDDTLIGGPGADELAGGPGKDSIAGNGGPDLLQSGSLSGYCGDDLTSSAGDLLQGGDGDDILLGSSGADTLVAGPGDDGLFGAGGDDSLDGDDGGDVLVGQDGNDALSGGAGDDELTGGSGDDSELGGEGNDHLGRSWLLLPPFASSLERDNGDDTMDGGAGDDLIDGGPGEFLVNAGNRSFRSHDEGSEVAEPNGRDSMHGGSGRDTVTYVKRSSPVALSIDGEANDGAPQEGDRIGSDIEAVAGGSGDDQLTGTAGGDELDGGKGSDSIRGGAGDDVLRGGRGDEGRDQIAGGDGNDVVEGINGRDVLSGGRGHDSVGGGGGADVLDGGDGNDALTGGPGGDLIKGGSGNDRMDGADPSLPGADGDDHLLGEAGSDSLAGSDGDDKLSGGSGPDELRGGSGLDSVDYSAAEGAVTITLDGRANDGRKGERDNFGADIEGGQGGSEKDVLSGNKLANTLSGGSGEDFLDGRRGRDRLNGNHGHDVVQARDGMRDLVSCGPGFDLAIADSQDVVRDNCEMVDRSERPAAALGRVVSIRLVRGDARVRLRGMDRFFPLVGKTELPVRSTVDARRGSVELSTRSSEGLLRTSLLRRGAFMVDQVPSRSPLTDIRLRGGALDRCGARTGTLTSNGHRFSRTLWVRARERLRVSGRYGYAQAHRATWSTTDRCDGTLVRVRQGRVTFFDRSLGRRFTLRAGEARLARR